MDFDFWDTLTEFPIYQIVDLWAKGDGLKYEQAAAINRRVKKAVASRQIPCLDMENHYDYKDWRDIEDDWTITRTDIKNWCESVGYRPRFLFKENRQPAPAPTESDNPPLSATERGNLQKQIAALAMLLSGKSAQFKWGDGPNATQLARAVQFLLNDADKELANLKTELNRYGVSETELRRNIAAGMALLFQTVPRF